MKQIILFFIYLFIFTSSLYAKDFKWSYAEETIDGYSKLYVDEASIRKVGKYHYFWLLTDYVKLDEGDNPNIHSVQSFNILNCASFETKVLNFIAFKENMAKGPIVMEFIIPDEDIDTFEWVYFDLSTAFGGVIDQICK